MIRFWSLCGAAMLAVSAMASSEQAEWSFRTHIVPVLTKAGCNAGACHGSAAGQGGFHLSLLGYDAEEDFWNITREFSGRRIDMEVPEESLILKKPARQLEHEGGRKLPRGSEEYQTVLRWIQAGAPFGSKKLQVTKLQATPADSLLHRVEDQTQLKVTATFSDGNQREVTDLALFSSQDDGVAEVKRTGLVTVRGRGLTSIMVRFGGQVAAARIAVPYSDSPAPADPLEPLNFIDREIFAELRRLGLPSSPLCSNEEFIRRVTLDLTGRLPEMEGKTRKLRERDKIVDALLASESFVDYWTLKFADLLLISGKRGSEQATVAYHNWLRAEVAKNTPWNEIARTLVSATGDVTRSGPANFLTLANDPRDLSEHASSILLGTQIACARCHAHPSDRWTQKDYYEFAAYFAHVSREGNVVSDTGRSELKYPKSKIRAEPRPLGQERPGANSNESRRNELADWMASPENPFLARALVNRVWKHLLGRGLVEPVNDLRPTNPATHPRLLDQLAGEFIAHEYDIRWLIKTIVNSRTYQLDSRSVEENGMDDRFYSHALLKPLGAQVMVDAIAQVSGVPESFDGTQARAVQLIGAQTPSYALDVLGRCKREGPCEPAGAGGGLAQALHLINGTTINGKLSEGVLADLLKEGRTNDEIIRTFYLRALSRNPLPAEMDFWNQTLGAIPERKDALEDFLWTLLNSREFAYNH